MFGNPKKRDSQRIVIQSTRETSDPSDARRFTVNKFNQFLKGASRESRQSMDRNSFSRCSIQRKVTSIMNGEKVDERTSSKYEQSQVHLLRELRSKISAASCVLDKIDQEIDDEIYYSQHLGNVLFIQSRFRGRRARKAMAKPMKNHIHRRNVIEELLQTERGYSADLTILVTHTIHMLAAEQIIKPEHLEILVGNIKEIQAFHQRLVLELGCLKRDSFTYLFDVGTIYQNHIEEFKLYYNFCHNFNKAETLMKELKKTNEKLELFLNNAKKDPKMRYLGWEGFMVKPIQRLPKYNLLINDFIKHCESEHPLYPLYEGLLNKFLATCDENNKNILSLANSLKLLELEKYYGEPNQLPVLNRTYIKEEKMSFLIDGAEKNMLVYVLNDLILICEAATQVETGYKLFRHALLTENSYCQSIPNKRYFNNLTKIIAKNTSLTIICQNPEQKLSLIQQINYLISNIRAKSSKYDEGAKSCPDQIEVQVVGTEERSSGTLSQYTLYVLKVSIGRVFNDLFLRFSEVKCLADQMAKEHPDLQLPQLKPPQWLGNKESKIIEQRKLEIEDFIHAWLVSDTFYKMEKSQQAKYLTSFGLDPGFYEQPNQLLELEKQQLIQPSSTISQAMSRCRTSIFSSDDYSSFRQQATSLGGNENNGRMNASQLARIMQQSLSDGSSPQKQTETFVDTPTHQQLAPLILIDATIIFHDGRKLELRIPSWFRGYDLVQEVASKIGLKDPCDFRLFETDETIEKMRPIIDDEMMEHVLKKEKGIDRFLSLFKKKVVLFRKYIFFPRQLEETQDAMQQDRIRLDLVVSQAMFDIKRKTYTFALKDYCLIVALDLILNQKSFISKANFQYDWVKKIVPDTYLKEQSKSSWATSVLSIFTVLQIDISQICLLNQRMNQMEDGLERCRVEQEIEEKMSSFSKYYPSQDKKQETNDTREQFFKIQANKTVVAASLLLNLVSRNPLYGVTVYPVQYDQPNFDVVQKFVKSKAQKVVRKQGLAIGISIDWLGLFDDVRRQFYLHLPFSDIDLEAHSDQLVIWLEEKSQKITFQTQQGYQIVRLIQEYEYLQEELANIEAQQ